MDANTIVWIVVAGVLVAALLFVPLVLLVLLLVKTLGGTAGGWSRLVEKFPVERAPLAPLDTWQTIQIGAVVYKNCATLGVADDGLYIETARRAALIPWEAFSAVGEATLYWRRWPKLTVGDPALATLVVPESKFREMLPHLPERLRERSGAAAGVPVASH